ncbi:MAG: hypothetical protein ACNA8W_23790 [Bradymonadaceae bacterium]
MSKISFKELKDRAENIYQRYDAHFAGKSRATRDQSLIEGLIKELEVLVEEGKGLLNGSKDPALLSVLDMAKNNLEVYRTERAAIAEAQADGPQAVESSRIIARANVVFGTYHRHFAGKERRTRDLHLLDEIVEELEDVRSRMAALVDEYPEALRPNLEVVDGNIEMYRAEKSRIDEARRTGSQSDQGDTLAHVANEQFEIYRSHFAGKSRHTRRTGLLSRVNAELTDIQSQMRALKSRGFASDANERNLDVIAKNLDLYRSELEEIKKSRQTVTSEQYAGSLGAEANALMAEYREHFAGQNRATRDLGLLSRIADGMRDIVLQMEALQKREPTELNERNLNIVLDSWSMYEAEYKRVEQAKTENS